MALRRASESVTRVDLGDGDWIEVRDEISKKAFRRIVRRMPNRSDIKDGLTPDEGMEFQAALFDGLVTAWSLDAPPSVEEYEALLREDCERLDTALAEHFGRMTATKEEQGKD